MDMSWWRDLVIIIWGLVATIGVAFLCVIIFLFYRKTMSILESADSLAAKINDVVGYAQDEMLKPAALFSAMIHGLVQGIGLFANIFKKKEKGSDE